MIGVEGDMFERIKCFLTGWECIGTSRELKKRVDPNVIKILEGKSTKKFYHLAKGVYENSVKGYTVYIKGSTYQYKAIVPPSIWIDNQGHGGFIQGGPMVIYRKKIKG